MTVALGTGVSDPMKKSVLIVEDGETLLRNLARSLRGSGYSVTAASYGGEARCALEESAIDILCLDIQLPDCNGLDLLTELRERHPHLPVVVMTGQDSPENKARAEALGAHAFMVKPFRLAALQEVVSGVVTKTPDHAGPPRRIMMYSHDGFGLGHVKRNTNIATRFVAECPGSSVLMLVGCPYGAMFELPAGVDYLKLPSIIKVATGEWRSRGLHISAEQTKAIRSATIQNAVEQFEPDLLLVDHVPIGVWGELLPTLQFLQSQTVRPKIVLGLRDILDAPEVVESAWRKDDTYDAIDRYYDHIFVYGDEKVFDTAAHYRLGDAGSGKVHYCGYLTSTAPFADNPQLRHGLPPNHNKLVVVVGGGGYDAYPMMAKCIEAWPLMGNTEVPNGILITGPLMPPEQRAALQSAAKGFPVRVLNHVEDSRSYISAANLVVTMAGYNALLESLRLRKKTLVIPRSGPSAEQRMRSQVFSALGLVQWLDPDTTSSAEVARAIRANVENESDPPAAPHMDGATNTVRRMRELIASNNTAQSLEVA